MLLDPKHQVYLEPITKPKIFLRLYPEHLIIIFIFFGFLVNGIMTLLILLE